MENLKKFKHRVDKIYNEAVTKGLLRQPLYLDLLAAICNPTKHVPEVLQAINNKTN